MYKILFIIICWTVLINAQILSGYGIKVGMGITNQDWTSDNINMDFNNHYDITARISANVLEYSQLSLLGEIGYSGKGFNEKVDITTIENPDGTGISKEYNIKLNYLSLSLLGRLKFAYGMFTPYLLLGPQYNYLLSKNVDKDFQIAFDNYNKNSLGITTGAGTEIITGIFNLVIEYRYERDLTNPSSTGFKMRNYSHNILAGIIF